MSVSKGVSTANITPAWVDRMGLHRWYALSGDRPDLELQTTAPGTRYLIDTDPARDARVNPARSLGERLRRTLKREPASAWRGTTGFSAITEAWNGAAYASRFGPSGAMIVFGGGHDDYYGSSVHAFDLASREWRRLTDGYVSVREDDYGQGARYPDAVYPDGSPLPPHTYGYVQYDPARNDYLLLKGQIELGRNVEAIALPHVFNLDTLEWRRGPRHPTALLNSGGWTTWDESRRILWGHSGDDGGGNAFIGYAPDGDNGDGSFGRWTEHYPNKLPGAANENAMQIDTVFDVIIVCVHAHDALYAIDPAEPQRAIVRLQSTDAKPLLRPCAALEHAPNLRRLVYFSPLDRGTVYGVVFSGGREGRDKLGGKCSWEPYRPEEGTLDPIADAARRSRYPVNIAQTFGRFRIASFGAIDLAILVRHCDSPVYAMRLTR